MKKLLKNNKNGEARVKYPCGYGMENLIPCSKKYWEGSPWRAFLLMGRGM